jgi:hypothetical protein
MSLVAGNVQGFVGTAFCSTSQEVAMDHVGLYTITLVFTDLSRMDYQVICLGLDGVYEQADAHFLATHADDSVELSHLIITNQDGVVIARWEGVAVSGL